MNHAIESLDLEIGAARRKISTDSYPMSIGEITNLYREKELVISPAFQRLFRWESEQKSRLIESILLGIPLPSIFVSQTDSGKWELIDGLQRVSTILQLQGILEEQSPLVLSETKYLPHLAGRSWDGAQPLSDAQKLDFKRSKLDVKIIKRESDESTKYDLFQRLNSYGSPLTAQEMRHALLSGVSSEFASWVEELAGREDFLDTVALPEKSKDEKYDEDLVLRFLFLHSKEDITPTSLRSFNQKLDDGALEMASSYPTGSQKMEHVFKSTFSLLNQALGDDAFRKWNQQKDRFQGGFLNTAFEVLAMGVGFHLSNGSAVRSDLRDAAKELWLRPEMSARFATGVSTEKRLSQTIPLGRELMAG